MVEIVNKMTAHGDQVGALIIWMRIGCGIQTATEISERTGLELSYVREVIRKFYKAVRILYNKKYRGLVHGTQERKGKGK